MSLSVDARMAQDEPTIELLFFDGCPNHDRLLAHVRELLGERASEADVALVRISSDEEAAEQRFLGSPTMRVDGRDVEPGADERTDFGLTCRLYSTPHGLSGMPDDAWILAALSA
jgi:hypothetical protein